MRCFLLLALAFVLPPPAAAKADVRHQKGDLYDVTFTFTPQIAPSTVSLAGTFNNWRKDELILQPDGAGAYRLELSLPTGRYAYKFVLNGEIWNRDPDNPSQEPDGFEGFNSVLRVGDAASSPAAAAKLADGRIVEDSVLHRQTIEFCEWVPKERLVVLRLRTAHDDVERVLLRGPFERPLERVYSKDAHDYWETTVPEPPSRFEYAFELVDGSTRSVAGPFVFDASSAPSLDAPDWAADAVFYQIFPERFANADPGNDPPGAETWGGNPATGNFFGGDLEGIARNLPYLKRLGVTALYLNPIFLSPSNHKYDTADYLKVDPHLGGEAAFERLAAAVHQAGMRLILDGVFNHSGDRFWAFQDAVKNGAKSRYADWYSFRGFPVTQSPPNYACWWNFGHLPKLNTANPEVREHLLGVAAHWLKRGADGWRLDVPNEVPHDFWPEFRNRVRKAKPDAYLVGEIWNDALEWLGGREFDAVMNYVFRSAVLAYFASGELSLEDFDARLLEQRHRYPRASLPAQFNLLGSHDTKRLWSAFSGNVERLKLAVFFQMTCLGAPVVYYGDEIGLPGEKDPDCRRCFPWDARGQDASLLEHYRKLIAIRNSSVELRRGDFKTVHLDARRDVYAFLRRGSDRAVSIRSPELRTACYGLLPPSAAFGRSLRITFLIRRATRTEDLASAREIGS
ncbi:MAG: alpha amylase N-terminal ig-like domain-containing protein [Elusimicrobia bacterium]|nr:alpha amylase N-terminal ig-like domain-containing protein [Elusimicrobiota bacterium]